MSVETLIQSWVRPEIRAMSAYHVPDARGLIKLDAMENPYTWPDGMRNEWADLLRQVDVNRYPDPAAQELKLRLREKMGIPAGAGLLLGNGSDEIIQMLALTLGGAGRMIMSVEPGFVMYRMIAAFSGSDYVGVPLREEGFELDLPALLAAMRQHQPALIFIAYPNNPSGNLFDANDIRTLIEAAPGLVIVDEAYAPFTDESFLPAVLDYDNLLVMRTLSKMGLAGLRLGLLAGAPAWVREIDKTRMPYNINVLTQISADFALRHQAVFDEQTANIREQRDWLYRQLQALDGLRPYPSQANFILARTEQGRAADLFHALKERGVLIKNLHGAHPMLSDCLRLTIGTPQENQTLLAALRAVLNAA